MFFIGLPKLPSDGEWVSILRQYTAFDPFAADEWKKGDSSQPTFSDLEVSRKNSNLKFLELLEKKLKEWGCLGLHNAYLVF